MKKFIIILCAIVLSSFTKNETQEVKSILTSGKWFVESTQESGQEPEMTSNKNDEWIVFHADGKVEEGLYGDVTASNWEYLAEEKSIKISGDETVYKRVIEISADKLVVEAVDNLNSDDTLMVTYIK
ncbi:hypothetical protein C7447_102490 [Tenacibaculum adriaticum]|uniref:Lipocalin-like protein n=1 Tax=Tenacibaculum adriaticum TaxID=413713 RepID=A0A5S5DTF7_9FLAO|nr:hypothetical protein [Tenacibaculum adriaticum]TYP99171.1 hypothetical protein C7447_102490 [Tenacibaculum adriaticum]